MRTVPSIVTAVLAVATAGLFALGQILVAIGFLVATLVVAVVNAEVVALGAARHPANQTRRAQLTA